MVVCDNTVAKRGLLSEHGLSLYIEMPDEKILLDTGQGDVLEVNTRTLGIPHKCDRRFHIGIYGTSC
jgi:7,8-dihydropterin-6-yl-methyl-4-(beta-D-ribofuranosyl)aminobenzene 5'-phosphate synthase